MKFLSFRRAGKNSYGVLTGRGIVDLGARHPELADLRAVLRLQQLPELSQQAASLTADFSADEVEFLPTIPNPEKIICIGVNYANRNAEYADGSALPEYPSVFMRTRESLVGHQGTLLRPPESEQLDYEGEIVLVIGKEGRRIPRHQAVQHIAGLTLMNEGSVRDWLRHSKFNVTQGKNFEHSGALGPSMVSSDELDPMTELRLLTRVNGEERQNDTTANLMFPFDYLVSYVSTFYRLKPGDIIATGTPNGAGARFNPPRYLKPGDVVEVEVAEIGVLRNTV
ncbi:MAG TPA: fumarylacetoacetate hydrolase family protein, partial [Xanthomonadales bacterium]|nr:fumarylacetoacetate hydrolase family protein [Xanthomonadales bacterium]